MNVAYQNFSDVCSKPLTGCIKQGTFVLVLAEIVFIVLFQHITLSLD